MKAPTFIDQVHIRVRAGNGGNGVATFRREKFVPYGGPDGGDGGRGGHVDLVASHDVASLLSLYYQPQQKAEHGTAGRGKNQTGRAGRDRNIPVPCGTEVWDEETESRVGEVLRHNDRLRVAEGGRGGLGNLHFKSSTHQAPRECTPGEKGQERRLRLDLKLISDAGLVGFPNAGKSSILHRISPARPKVAPYPFTTLHPVIGTVDLGDYRTCRVADIPGLISGAHAGVGLGHAFLRHIERTRLLIWVIDLSGVDGRSPVDDYFGLLKELEMYRPELIERPRILVANKMDTEEARTRLPEFSRRTGQNPLRVSAETGEGIEALISALRTELEGQ